MRTILAGIGILILALAGYFAASHYAGNKGVARVVSIDDCDPGTTKCRSKLQDGTVIWFSISPRPIPLMKPLRVVVEVDGAGYVPNRLDITGLNMEMGLNRTSLQPDTNSRWTGETILPICSQRRMHWQAALRLDVGGEQLQLLYRFHTTGLEPDRVRGPVIAADRPVCYKPARINKYSVHQWWTFVPTISGETYEKSTTERRSSVPDGCFRYRCRG